MEKSLEKDVERDEYCSANVRRTISLCKSNAATTPVNPPPGTCTTGSNSERQPSSLPPSFLTIDRHSLTAMPHMLDVVPAELVARIFSFLESDRRDVSRCRLVCKTFHELSSPFLITKVVFALRLDTITRMREVVEHAYFSKYVHTLVYDASKYRSLDWGSYARRCIDAPRELIDQTWIKRKQDDHELLTALSRLGLDDSGPSESALVDLANGHFHDLEELYRMGLPKTFPEHQLRFETQTSMILNKIPRKVLRDAFKRLPKLSNIVFTDYRSLARPGESYDALCKRLFGLVLEPVTLSDSMGSTSDIMALHGALTDNEGSVAGPVRLTSSKPPFIRSSPPKLFAVPTPAYINCQATMESMISIGS